MLMGMMFLMFLGIGPVAGAVLGFGAGFIPQNAVNSLRLTVFTEVWTGELNKQFRAADTATWMDGIPDMSQYANNDVIHLVDIGVDPAVLINNTTYPIPATALVDSDAPIGLDKYQTEVTPITDDELYALSYDKIASVKERHALAIIEKKYAKAIHSIAPAADAALTPVLKTTGADDVAMGRKMITRNDIIALKKKFDEQKVPMLGRRLVLCPDHVNDLLLTDQKFAEQYYAYSTGKINNMYGFEVFEYADNPFFNGTSGAKKAFASAVVPGTDFMASVAFYTKRVVKVNGSTTMYYSQAQVSPRTQQSEVNFRHYFIVLPKMQNAIGAIISAVTEEI